MYYAFYVILVVKLLLQNYDLWSAHWSLINQLIGICNKNQFKYIIIFLFFVGIISVGTVGGDTFDRRID